MAAISVGFRLRLLSMLVAESAQTEPCLDVSPAAGSLGPGPEVARLKRLSNLTLLLRLSPFSSCVVFVKAQYVASSWASAVGPLSSVEPAGFCALLRLALKVPFEARASLESRRGDARAPAGTVECFPNGDATCPGDCLLPKPVPTVAAAAVFGAPSVSYGVAPGLESLSPRGDFRSCANRRMPSRSGLACRLVGSAVP